jgi:tRNA (guanine37-N1)-methyltransferase
MRNMHFNIITIFPEIFNSYFNESILKRAQKNKIIEIKVHDLRKWTTDKHKTIDDTPYGGGAGMVMKVEPITKALQALKLQITNYPSLDKRSGAGKLQKNSKSKIQNSKVVLLSAKGKRWNQQMAKKYSKLDNIILICGRYEGVDERVKKFVDEEISIGDYILTGGEIPAMALVDSVTRLLPGSLGNIESAKNESHSEPGVLEYPQYTRPEIFETAPFNKGGQGDLKRAKKLKVPKILLSGNHKKIEEWRKKNKKQVTSSK